MKMEIIVKIKNDDGTEIIKPVVIDTEIPEFEEFKCPDNFRKCLASNIGFGSSTSFRIHTF